MVYKGKNIVRLFHLADFMKQVLCLFQLLSSYLFRATPEQVSEFLKKESFHLLGAQFYQYLSHTEQLEESISLILGLRFTFDSEWASLLPYHLLSVHVIRLQHCTCNPSLKIYVLLPYHLFWWLKHVYLYCNFSLEISDLEMTPVQQSAVVLLLSLLENTLWDVALCHNTLLTTRQVRPWSKVTNSLFTRYFFTQISRFILCKC